MKTSINFDHAKPILFSTPMVQQLPPRGIKTQTRRVVKIPKWTTDAYDDLEIDIHGDLVATCDETGCQAVIRPKYQPGDILWVRETWTCQPPDLDSTLWDFCYAADGERRLIEMPPSFNPILYKPDRWRPSIHMPSEAARIFLRVKRVWAERVHDISEADAIAEGCCSFKDKIRGDKFKDATCFDLTARDAYAELWDSLNAKRDSGKYAWANNPWVWVYEFERVEKL